MLAVHRPGHEEETMPGHHGFVRSSELQIRPREWHDLEFDRRDDGTVSVAALAGTSPEALAGVLYDLSVGVVLRGATPGTEVQLRAAEFESDGRGGFRMHRERPALGLVHAVGHGRFTYHWKGALAVGHWVGVQVAQFGEADAHLVSAEADVLTWRH